MQVTYPTKQASFEAIKAFVVEKLEQLSPDLTYHNLNHTLDVVIQSERIAKEEGVNDEHQLYLLKVAALYHDTGFLRTYGKHEEVSCSIFLEDAKLFGFSCGDCELITKLIMATKLPQTPATLLEKVICDADLDYLGRADFFEIGDGLRKEFLHQGIIKTNQDWDQLQIKFLTNHQYHTATSRKLREKYKQGNIAKLP
jgi:uncharacterized protein